jgi:hypothetical protein
MARLAASSQAARRLGLDAFIVGLLGWRGTDAFSPASRVGFSELFDRGLIARLDQKLLPERTALWIGFQLFEMVHR